MSLPSVAVIIPARNEAANLPQVLTALRDAASTYQGPCELLLVDNGSSDNTADIAVSFGCRVIEVPQGSIARLRNMGAEQSRSEILAFLDADCIVDRNWIRSCVAILEDRQIGLTGTPAVPDFNNATWVELAWYRLVSGAQRPVFPNWIGSSNMFMNRMLFNEIGGFDEQLVTAEDVNLCHKIRQTRLICLNKELVTIHLRESKTLCSLLRKEIWRGKGSIRQLIESKRKADDAPSIIGPVLQLSCGCCAVLLSPFNPHLAALLLAAVLLLPLVLIIRKKAMITGFTSAIQIYLVAFVFLMARSVAIIAEIFTIITGEENKGEQHA